jgi:hypothetical protein
MENINEHDMTKRMLDRMRTGNHQANSLNENTQLNVSVKQQNKGIIDEHDMTKQILGIIRENNAEMESTFEDNNNDVIKVENDELGEEAGKLRDMVGGVDLRLYEVYPKEKNVVMVGVLDNGVEFKFSKKEGAPYINMENMRLDAETVDVIKKLQGYYVNWTQYWAEKISEYTHSV